jgi:hypothetical protein
MITMGITPFDIVEWFTSLVFGFVEILLILRFIFRLLGADAAAPLVQWIYETTRVILFPFLNIFPNANLQGPFVVELNTFFAMIIYAIIYFAITQIIRVFEAATIKSTQTK